MKRKRDINDTNLKNPKSIKIRKIQKTLNDLEKCLIENSETSSCEKCVIEKWMEKRNIKHTHKIKPVCHL